MKKLVEWGVKMPVSGRVYHKGSISILNNEIEIKILGTHHVHHTIGRCKLVDNEIGLFATDIEYSIDPEKLNEIQESNIRKQIEEKQLHADDKFTKDLTIAVYGKRSTDDYFEKDSVELRFLYHDLFLPISSTQREYDNRDNYNINDIVRELKLDHILNEN
jgi:hypothetical protein